MKTGPHTLVTGKTDTGKSAVVKTLLPGMMASGKYQKLLVLDYKLDPRFGADLLTDDPEEFLAAVEALEDCLLVIDEGGATVGRYGGELQKISTMYRELGHQAFFISQRGAQIDKTIRENCSNLIVLMQGRGDAKALAESFPRLEPLIDDVPMLEQGEYIFVPSFGDPKRGRAF